MMEIDRQVTVIIPTTCDRIREQTLIRAVKSLYRQTIGAPAIAVIANGPRVDDTLFNEISAMPGVRSWRLKEGSLPRALAFGRGCVNTPYFGFLDDDDEYLPDALRLRLQALQAQPDAALCATDGYDYVDGTDRLRETVLAGAADDPLRGLLKANWLASCGGLFRTSLVSEQYFDRETKYYEWTLLGYKLAATRKVLLLGTPTYRLHISSGSLSRSEAYRLAEPQVLVKISQLSLPDDVRMELQRRVGRAYHGLAGYFLRAGRLREAWKYHAYSLVQKGGWRQLSYTAKLLMWRTLFDGKK